MKSFFKIALLMSFCCTAYSLAQCVKIVNAERKVMIGGREEARQEWLSVTIKENKKLEPLYFLVGDKTINFTKSFDKDNLSLNAILLSGQDNFPTTDRPNPFAGNTLGENQVFLVFKKVKNNKLIQKKINVKDSQSTANHSVMTGDLPQ
ncbi:MAG: hypothetical protein ACRC0E_05840 [Soonwooa sp.]